MIRKLQDILAWSLAEVGTGRRSVEASLAAHPEARDELEPLLRLALALEPPDLPKAPTALRRRIRVQLRQQAEVEEQTATWRSTLAGIARSLVTPFATGLGIGMAGAAICSVAIYSSDFWMFCGGTGLLGINNSFVQQYRFAAADVADAGFKSRAISLVLFGGVAAAVLGPQSVKLTQDLFAPITYLGSYLSIIGISFAAGLLLTLVRIPGLSAEQKSRSGRPLFEIACQPTFIVAVVGAMVGYGVMMLIMTPTPLSIVAHGHGRGDAYDVIAAHTVAMFGPSFFTGTAIKRFGVLVVMTMGTVLLAGCVAISVSGHDMHQYFAGLILLGIGWNFLFIGGTTLLTECYDESEKAKAQGFNDLLVFGIVAMTALSSGSIFHFSGWEWLNLTSIPFLLVTFVATTWLMVKRRQEARLPP